MFLLYLERRPSARITENTIRKLNRIKMLGKWLGTIDRIQREGINNLRNFSMYYISYHTVIYTRNYDAIKIIDRPISNIVLKLNQLIPKFHFIVKF